MLWKGAKIMQHVGSKVPRLSCQRMKVKKNEYVSNHVYENVASYQNVLNRDAT